MTDQQSEVLKQVAQGMEAHRQWCVAAVMARTPERRKEHEQRTESIRNTVLAIVGAALEPKVER